MIVKSISEYIEEINRIRNIGTGLLWYRGVSKLCFQNIPKVFRPDTWANSEYPGYDYLNELELFKEFKRKSKIKKKTDYEYLHLMQHFGLPTRLLDFTESPLIALFFALHEYKLDVDCVKGLYKEIKSKSSSGENETNPVVWVINPFQFNNCTQNNSTIYYFYDEVPELIQQYIHPKGLVQQNLPENPVTVIPAFEDERIIAQKSNFILFGKGMDSIESMRYKNKYDFLLEKIIIDIDSINKIFSDLISLGIDYFTIFPDMEGLVKELNRKRENGEIRKSSYSDLL